MRLPGFELREPETLEEAIDLLGRYGGEAKAVSGGTALFILMKHRYLRPRVLIGLRRLEELRYIRPSEGGVEMGALATHRQAEQSPLLRKANRLVAEVYREVASPPIREMATVGGNLAFAEPASDPAPALLALDAEAALRGPEGERRVPLTDFFIDFYETQIGPTDLLTRVRVPRPAPRTAGAYRNFRPASVEDKTLAGVAVTLTFEEGIQRCVKAGVAVGGVLPSPRRFPEAEEVLAGSDLSDGAVEAAAERLGAALQPVSDAVASAAYKRGLAKTLFRRAVQASVASARQGRFLEV